MVTLDSLQLTEVDFIKIDCEGYEENVLRGAVETIERDRPVIIVEQKRDMATARFGLEPLGAVKFLQSLGYKVAAGDQWRLPDGAGWHESLDEQFGGSRRTRAPSPSGSVSTAEQWGEHFRKQEKT